MLLVTSTFTHSVGVPATGLTLTDINFYLTRRRRSDGLVEVVWDGTQHPTEEITNVGQYTRAYLSEDVASYDYFARASYVGAVSLDVDHVTGSIGYPTFPAGGVRYEYTVYNASTGLPEPEVIVTVSVDANGDNSIWSGVTDAFGIARDIYDNLPLLDAGTYYFWKKKVGFIDDQNPDIEVVA